MQTDARINITQALDEAELGVYQLGIFILCGVCLIVDGFDVQAMGYIAPALIQAWKLQNAQMAPVFSATLLGVLLGSLGFSMLADKLGRRPVMIGATLFFAVLTMATAQAETVEQLRWLRFSAGLGLGGIMPNAVALCGEFSPKSSRVFVMMLVGNGFTAGAALGGFIAAWLIPHYGWRAVFYVGGAIPLVIALAMLAWLPESLQFLAVKGQAQAQAQAQARVQAKLAQALRRLNPAQRYAEAAEFFVPEQAQGGAPLWQLFRAGRARGTALLWTANFMNLLNLYFLSSWLPTVVRDAGYADTTGVYVGTTLQIGGTLGAILLGWLVKRFGFVAVLTPCFALAALNIAFIGWSGLSLALLFVVVFIAGVGVMGGQVGINALAATFYPTELRATGIGAGLGVGRLGAIAGPLVGGQLMAWHWSSRALFLAAAIPALVSACVLFAMRWVTK
ncbi:MAG: MFS transporter [Acidobacteria bacterium]|nr:MFS transporter [Acidobacteriota bacterium]